MTVQPLPHRGSKLLFCPLVQVPAQNWIFHLLLQILSILQTVQLKDHLAEWHNKNAVNYISTRNGTITAVDMDHRNQMKDEASLNQPGAAAAYPFSRAWTNKLKKKSGKWKWKKSVSCKSRKEPKLSHVTHQFCMWKGTMCTNVSKEGKNLVNSSWEIKTFHFWQWQQTLYLLVLELLILAYFTIVDVNSLSVLMQRVKGAVRQLVEE